MDVTVQGVICLIKSAITGLSQSLPEAFKLGLGMKLMLQQGVFSMGYIGALNSGFSPEHPALVPMLDYYCMDVMSSERQLHHIDRICEAFEEKGIEYMPVKGTLLKHMYPSHELRRMSDADILIREEKYAQIRPVMLELGFKEAGESDHEHIWTNEHLNVELHKRLMPTYNKDLYSYFGVGWEKAKIQKGCRWEMTKEDAFVYDFIHFAKHYRDGEANCRFVVDLWVYLRHYPDLDVGYIREQMAIMKMEAFYDNIMRLINCWFTDGEWDDRMERITDTLFASDAQQRKEIQNIAKSARDVQTQGSVKQSKQQSLMRKIFPDKEHMNWSYPQHKEKPLAVAWCLRWGDLIFHRRDVVKNRMAEMGHVNTEAVENYRQDLEYVGLQFSDSVALPD